MMEIDITDSSSFKKLEIQEALRTVMDPELNINIIDLGLVYEIELNETEKIITITMTLSSKFCPMGDAILQSVENCVEHNFTDYKAEVKLTWEPQWGYNKISKEGLIQLGR